jgi:hypothetical protein
MNTYDQSTKSISLEKYGIKNVKEIVYNPSYDLLYDEELSDKLQGFEKGQLTELGAVNVRLVNSRVVLLKINTLLKMLQRKTQFGGILKKQLTITNLSQLTLGML